MGRRGAAVVLGLVGSVLVGGVSQTYLWRWHLGVLGDVLGSQFAWVLLTFAVARAWSRGRVAPGAAAGALTGLALIVSYYAVQWVADGRHAAVSQFADARGPAWVLAAVAGGAVVGCLGGLAGRPVEDRPVLKALGLMKPAVVVALGPLVWVLTQGRYLDPASVLPAVVVFAAAGIALAWTAVRACGVPASALALTLSGASGAVLLGALLALETHGALYLTF